MVSKRFFVSHSRARSLSNLCGIFSANDLFVYLTFVSFSKEPPSFFLPIIVVFFLQIRSEERTKKKETAGSMIDHIYFSLK